MEKDPILIRQNGPYAWAIYNAEGSIEIIPPGSRGQKQFAQSHL